MGKREPMIEVAYGAPERSVTEEALLGALLAIAVNFDESPDQMHAVLGPPGTGVRWFTFASSRFKRGAALAERHFWELMTYELPELVMMATSGYGPGGPWRFEAGGTATPSLVLRREGDGEITEIAVYGPPLPSEARRDGDVAEVGLGALGLPLARPLETLVKPTHEVRLRAAGEVQRALRIQALEGPPLPCRVAADRWQTGRRAVERLLARPRRADLGNFSEMRDAIERLVAYSPKGISRRLVGIYGDELVPALVWMLEQPDLAVGIADVCLETLRYLRAAPEAVFPWLHRGPSARELACGALARMGEAARPVLEANAATDEAARALLGLLDDPRWARLREVRATRDEVAMNSGELDAALSKIPSQAAHEPLLRIFAEAGSRAAASVAYALQASGELPQCAISAATIAELAKGVEDLEWAVATYLVEWSRLDNAGVIHYSRQIGPAFVAVATQLLSYEPLSDDIVLAAVAAGRQTPSLDEQHAVHAARHASDPRYHPPMGKRSSAKKPARKVKAPS